MEKENLGQDPPTSLSIQTIIITDDDCDNEKQ